MADPVEVQRYDAETDDYVRPYFEAADDGDAVLYADVAPLLAELATLRERTRRRDAVTEPPPEGVWVLGRLALDHALAWVRPDRRMLVYYIDGRWLDEDNRRREIVAWWPLPEASDV